MLYFNSILRIEKRYLDAKLVVSWISIILGWHLCRQSKDSEHLRYMVHYESAFGGGLSRLCSKKNYKEVIQGAQHKAHIKEIRLSCCPKAKVSRLRHPSTLRAQPCLYKKSCWVVLFHVFLEHFFNSKEY